DQTMALQPHSNGVKIQDLMLKQQSYIQDESLFYQSLLESLIYTYFLKRNITNKIDQQCTLKNILEVLDYRLKEYKVNRLNPVSIEVLRYDIKRSKCKNGIVPTEMALELEQTQQGSSNEVSNIRVIPKYHSEDGNHARANIKQALGRRFFLRLNLPDHKLVLTGSGVNMEMEIPHSSGVYFITTCSYSTDTSKELMKVQVYASKLPQL
nr:hypothetical protein [Tanacetum cinerariifolium]